MAVDRFEEAIHIDRTKAAGKGEMVVWRAGLGSDDEHGMGFESIKERVEMIRVGDIGFFDLGSEASGERLDLHGGILWRGCR